VVSTTSPPNAARTKQAPRCPSARRQWLGQTVQATRPFGKDSQKRVGTTAASRCIRSFMVFSPNRIVARVKASYNTDEG